MVSVIYMQAVFKGAFGAVFDADPVECVQKKSKFFYFCHNIDGTEKDGSEERSRG